MGEYNSICFFKYSYKRLIQGTKHPFLILSRFRLKGTIIRKAENDNFLSLVLWSIIGDKRFILKRSNQVTGKKEINLTFLFFSWKTKF